MTKDEAFNTLAERGKKVVARAQGRAHEEKGKTKGGEKKSPPL